MRSGFALRKWLAQEVLDKDIGRKPPQKASALSKSPARSWRYRRWIRSFPCAACGIETGIEAAHTGPHGHGIKASDYTCIPLCRPHHRSGNEALDKRGRAWFEQRFSLDLTGLIQRLNRLWFHPGEPEEERSRSREPG